MLVWAIKIDSTIMHVSMFPPEAAWGGGGGAGLLPGIIFVLANLRSDSLPMSKECLPEFQSKVPSLCQSGLSNSRGK